MTFEELSEEVKAFIRERNWEQFEKPKDLILTLASEVGELAQHYQWLNEAEEEKVSKDEEKLALIQAEMADILLALINLSHTLNVDLLEGTKKKLNKLQKRYPVERVKDKHNNRYEGIPDALK